MQNGSGHRLDDYGKRIWNRVIDSDELEVEVAVLLGLPLGGDHDVWCDAVFFELGFQECESQRRSDNRNVIAQPQQVRHAADVVFVSVSQHDCEHVIHAITDVAEIRQDNVDARLGLLRKQNTTVDD